MSGWHDTFLAMLVLALSYATRGVVRLG